MIVSCSKIPGTARKKVSRLYLRKSWQVYNAYVTILIENKTLTKATVSRSDRKICYAYKELRLFFQKRLVLESVNI